MKRLLCLLAALLMATPAALAQSAVETQPLSGEIDFPAGADAASAAYSFRYACPQFEAQTDADKAINAYFASVAADMAAAAPGAAAAAGGLPAAGSPAYYTQVDYRVTANTDDFLSVLLTSRQYLGNTETENWTAAVFARDGVYAGQPVSLSQAMGLEQDAAADGGSYASGLVYGLVWQIIGEQQASLARNYYPELTFAALESAFSPESDFYLDGDGNFVFFIQSGEVAGEVEGILTYPFSLAELLSAVRDAPTAGPSGGEG